MLRKRSRAIQKEQSGGQLMPDSASDSCFSSDAVVQKARSTSFYSVPGLFVGFSSKGLSDSESARSPTSPLDYKVFSNLGNSFVRSPRSPGPDGQPRSWDCSRVGLGLVDSLNDENKPCGKVLGISDSRNILFGAQMRINIPSPKTHLGVLRDESLGAAPKSLPKDYGVSSQTSTVSRPTQLGFSKMAQGSKGTEIEPGEFGKMRSCSADVGRSSLLLSHFMYQNPKSSSEVFSSKSNKFSIDSPPLGFGGVDSDNFSGSLPIPIGSSCDLINSLSASEIELSEDYTCIISHGPVPKTTHIFGDCILESHLIPSPCIKDDHEREQGGSRWLVKCTDDSPDCPSCDFLSFCFSCKKKLEEGKDIYMYRGEKAFCSSNCRDREIFIEEEMEKPATDSSGCPDSSFHEEIFMEGMVVAT